MHQEQGVNVSPSALDPSFPHMRAVASALICGAIILASTTIARAAPDMTQLQGWIDSTMSGAIAGRRASGIAVAVVNSDQTVFLKGYGQASAGSRQPVDPRRTLFSLGSITKNFTATAIEQLLERGRIHSLDDRANQYLRRFQIPGPLGEQVTIRNLLDHRGGFDESVYDLVTRRAVQVPITGAEILTRLPRIIRRPGEISVYSNAGYGVLGALIEDVSGVTYAQFIKTNVLEPLGMASSFIRYSPGEPLATPGNVAADGKVTPILQDWAYHPFIAPSASLVSTAADMARFMSGQMLAERGRAPWLVSVVGAHHLHDRHTANAPYGTGFGMSFFAHRWNGERIAENAGSGPGFQATMILLPDRGVAFIAMIMGGAVEEGQSLDMFEVREHFLDYYLGPLRVPRAPPSSLPMSRYAGVYRNERRPHLTDEALLNPGTTLRVEPSGPHTLTINGRRGYEEVAPHVFWKAGVIPFVPEESSSDLYTFLVNANGVVRGVVPYLGMDVYRPAWLAPSSARIIAIVLLLICATGLLAPLWRAPTRTAQWAHGLAFATALLSIAMPVFVFLKFDMGWNTTLALGFGDVTPFIVVAALANLLVICVAALLALVGLSWRRRSIGSVARTLHLSVILIAGVALVPLLGYFRLLGFNIPGYA
jgi:CubicO group peptidase (beta-lactamase class C family)